MDLHERRTETLRRRYAALDRLVPREIAHGDHLAALFVVQEATEPASGDERGGRVAHLWTFAGDEPVRMEVFAEHGHPNLELFERFHSAQAAMYARGDEEAVAGLLAADAEWHVPGRSAIAGSYRGRDEVIGYFRRRRDLAGRTFRIDVHERLAADAGVVTLAYGEAELRGAKQRWGTAGVYRFAEDVLFGGWLLPTDQEAFDRIWS